MSAETPARPIDEHCDINELCVRPLARRAFGLLWDHAGLLVSAHLIILLIFIAANFLLTISGNVLLGPFILGAYKISQRLARNQNTDLGDLLSGFEYFLPAFLANLLVHVLAAVGFALLVVPGLVVLLAYSPVFLIILDENPGFWDAMEKSRHMVLGNLKRWAVLGLVILAVNLAGALFFGVGLLATIPYSCLLVTLAYEEEVLARKRRGEFEAPPLPLASGA